MSVRQESLSFGIVDRSQVFTISRQSSVRIEKKRLSSPCPTFAAPDNPKQFDLFVWNHVRNIGPFSSVFPCVLFPQIKRSQILAKNWIMLRLFSKHDMKWLLSSFLPLIAMFCFPSKWTSFKISTKMCLLVAICTYRWASSWQAILFIFSSKDAHEIRALLKT